MGIPREVTNFFNYILDNIIPPILRDQYWFMAPCMKLILGPKYKYYMEFKEKASVLTEKQINEYYILLSDTFIKRNTDLNKMSVDFILKNIKGNSVIDVGCGRGYLTKQILQNNNDKLIYGYDILPPDKFDGITYESGTVLSMPYSNNQFDTVICAHTLEHIYDINKAITELIRITKDRLIIVVPRQREYKYTFDLHIHFFPYKYNLGKLINLTNANIYNFKNDFIYVVDF